MTVGARKIDAAIGVEPPVSPTARIGGSTGAAAFGLRPLIVDALDAIDPVIQRVRGVETLRERG